MKDGQVRFGMFQLVHVQDIAVFQPQIVFLVKEALPLYPGHIQDIQLGHGGFQVGGLLVGDVLLLQDVLLHVGGNL